MLGARPSRFNGGVEGVEIRVAVVSELAAIAAFRRT